MSTKQTQPMVNVNFRIPAKMDQEIVSAADIAEVEKSEIVRRALAIGISIMKSKGFNLTDLYLSDSSAPSPKPLESLPTTPAAKRNGTK